MPKKSATLGVIMLLPAIMTGAPRRTSVSDPAGDALYNAPSCMDIVGTVVEESQGTFEFEMSLAGAIPVGPLFAPPSHAALWWNFAIDVDQSAFPIGFPNAPGLGQGAAAEFVVIVEWDGTAFSAALWDRRPLLTGGEARGTPVTFTIDGSVITAWVDSSLMGSPSGFLFSAVTVYAAAEPGSNDGRLVVDHLTPRYNPWP